MSGDTRPRPVPLAALHAESGCDRWAEEGGWRVPADYGDPARERERLSNETGLYDGTCWGRVEVLGEDAGRLLNGFTTLDVPAVEAGSVRWGLVPGPKGHVLADVTVSAHNDRLWLRLPPGQGKSIREHLSKYVIAEDVELLPMGDLIPIWLLGPAAESCLRQAGVDVPARHQHARSDAWGTEVQLEHAVLLGMPGICLSVSASVVKLFAVELAERLDLGWIGRSALESARIRAGALRWGYDFGPDTLPQEAGLNAAVDYEKGCYLGQEVIARLHYRGQERRRLCLIEVQGEVDENAVVAVDGEEVGALTSLDPLRSPDSATRAIAMIRRDAIASDSGLAIAVGASATVIRLLEVDRHGLPVPEATGGK